MACGTPVIAMRRGSMPEIVEHRRTGFLVDSPEAAVDAIDRAGSIDRRLTSESVARRFSVDSMADEYLALYHRILAREPTSVSIRDRRTAGTAGPRRAPFWA